MDTGSRREKMRDCLEVFRWKLPANAMSLNSAGPNFFERGVLLLTFFFVFFGVLSAAK